MIRRRMVILFIGIGVVAAASIAGWHQLRSVERDEMCRRRLQNLKYLIEMYANTHKGHFPPDLEAAARDEDVGRWILDCPSVSSDLNATLPPGYCDYTFIDWPAFTDRLPPQTQPDEPAWRRKELEKYPMVFERHLKNSLGTGVHVILVDGTVLWDSDARWLKRFAAAHPEVSIPLPR